MAQGNPNPIPEEWKLRMVTCVDCGIRFVNTTGNKARCANCQIEYRKAYTRQYKREYRKRTISRV